jgi:periplasmic divalent cation tolerance protein
MKNKFVIIETTYPDLEKAKNLGKLLLDQKIAACVNFLPISSMYLWEDKIADEQEILVSIKTLDSLYKNVEKVILKHHVYKNPKIISKLINKGSRTYLEWILFNLKKAK